MAEIHNAITSGRLAVYLHVATFSGSSIITSEDLSAASGVHATMVRRDFSTLFDRKLGKRGSGYDRRELASRLETVLRDHVPMTEALAQRFVLRAQQVAWAAQHLRGSHG